MVDKSNMANFATSPVSASILGQSRSGNSHLYSEASVWRDRNQVAMAVKSANPPGLKWFIFFLTAVLCFWSTDSSVLQAQQEKTAVPVSGKSELPNLFPGRSRTLVGSVLRYDAFLSSHSPEADMLLRLKEAGNKYLRLLYSPGDFGFDAPPATPSQLLPQEMFSDGKIIWTLHAHAPRNEREKTACASFPKQLAPAKDGQLVEVERYSSVPGTAKEQVPQAPSLECMIVESWSVVALLASAQPPAADQSQAQETQARGYWIDPSTGLMWARGDEILSRSALGWPL